ncbi:MAG: hypothetical protein U0R52_07380 [Solirubrobacterales bacterium]
MPLRRTVELAHLPDLDAGRLIEILRGGLGDRYEASDPGRFQVPDAMVKRSDPEGAAVRITQRRRRGQTLLRVWPLAPSLSRREWRPGGLARQSAELRRLTDEVVEFLEGAAELHPEA